MIVVHLHNTKKGGTSTALLVDNATTKQGTTVLLPNSLAVAGDDGTTTTLGKSVDDDGSDRHPGVASTPCSAPRSAAPGGWTPRTWRTSSSWSATSRSTPTPMCPTRKKGAAPLVKKGEAQTLSGQMAVAYATYRGARRGRGQAADAVRAGHAARCCARSPTTRKAATVTVQTLAQILDPSLPEKDLGASLAKLAEHAKGGDYKTALLPVQHDGTLTDAGHRERGQGHARRHGEGPDAGRRRAGRRQATPPGTRTPPSQARVALVNGGYTFVGRRQGRHRGRPPWSLYARRRPTRRRPPRSPRPWACPPSAVKKGEPAANADVSVVLGQDYKSRWPGPTAAR